MADIRKSPIQSVDVFDYLLLLPEITDDPNYNRWWQKLFETNPSFADFLAKEAGRIANGDPTLTQKILKSLLLACVMIERASEI